MLDPLTASLIAAGASGTLNATQQFLTARRQKQLANRVQVQDSTTDADREVLASARHAAYGMMPGEATAVTRLGQGFQQGAAAIGQGATSAGAYLGGLTRLDANRSAGTVAIADQSARYRVGQQATLRGVLSQVAERRRQDVARAAAEKAALIEGSNRNLAGGLSTLGNTAVGVTGMKYGASEREKDRAAGVLAAPVAPAVAPAPVAYRQFLPPPIRAGIPRVGTNQTAAYQLRMPRNPFVAAPTDNPEDLVLNPLTGRYE